jgi:3-hydroxybutyryl-CoA dehydrogenase
MQRVAVLGVGTMGQGIAQVAALAGHVVELADARDGAAEAAVTDIRARLASSVAKGRIDATEAEAVGRRLRARSTVLEAAAGAGIVIEAIYEDVPAKRAVLAAAEAVMAPDGLLSSNTSSLSIGVLAEGLMRPDRFLGTHFFNPVPVMALLELVSGAGTADTTVQAWRALGAAWGKDVIVVRDMPGFATSRLGVALGMEAIRMVEQGVASAADIDKAMVLGYRHPIGPLALTDLVGLDVRMAIGEYLATSLGNPAFAPPGLMRQMVADGRLGKKAGEGFYRYGT